METFFELSRYCGFHLDKIIHIVMKPVTYVWNFIQIAGLDKLLRAF